MLLIGTAACGPQEQRALPPAPTVETSNPAPPRCTDSELSNPAEQTGSKLTLSSLGFTASNGQLNFAVPDALSSRYPALRPGPLTDVVQAWEPAMRDGAFIYGHPDINVFLHNPTDREIVFTGIAAANTRTVCMPTGVLAVLGTDGGDEVAVAMDFDAARPVALVPTDGGTVPSVPFFHENGIAVAPDGYQQILIRGRLAREARTFDIALTYLYDGGKFVQLIRPEGGPFRVTPSMCPQQMDQESLSDEDIERLGSHRFAGVLQQGDFDTAQNRRTVAAVSHDVYVQSCPF